jgi:predicted ester cyclase
MSSEDLRAVVTAAIERFNDRDNRDGFLDAYAPDVTLHGYPAGMEGHEGLRRFHRSLWDAFPDARIAVEDVVVEDDRAALRYRLTGTHRRPYLSVAPTGLSMDVQGMMIVRIADGLVAEEWHSPTELSILRQLGVIEVSLTERRERGRGPGHSASADAAALRWEERHGG